MKTAIIAAAIVGSVSAFAPALPKASVSSTSISASVWDKYPGGEDFRGAELKFDPFKLSETYAPFQAFFRESELRHCRTAMLAVAGYIVADFVRIPGAIYSFENVPSSAAAHDILVQSGPMHQLLLWISLWDIVITFPSIQAMNKGEREPGGKKVTYFNFGQFSKVPIYN